MNKQCAVLFFIHDPKKVTVCALWTSDQVTDTPTQQVKLPTTTVNSHDTNFRTSAVIKNSEFVVGDLTCCTHGVSRQLETWFLNLWPTFSPYLYNRVWSELTCCNSLSQSRLACSRLSAHIQPSVWQPRYEWRCEFCCCQYLQRSCLQWNKLVTLVYSTVDSGLTYT